MIFYRTLKEWDENKNLSPHIIYRGGLFECNPDCELEADLCTHFDWYTDENIRNMCLVWDKLNLVWRPTKDLDLSYVYLSLLPNINVLTEGYNVYETLLYSKNDKIFLDGRHVSAEELIKYPDLRMILNGENRRAIASLVETKDEEDKTYFFMRDLRAEV